MIRHYNDASGAVALAAKHDVTPTRRTTVNPFAVRRSQIVAPAKTRSLPNGHVYLSDVDLGAQTVLDLLPIGCLEEERERLLEIRPSLLNRSTLARDVNLRTEGDI